MLKIIEIESRAVRVTQVQKIVDVRFGLVGNVRWERVLVKPFPENVTGPMTISAGSSLPPLHQAPHNEFSRGPFLRQPTQLPSPF